MTTAIARRRPGDARRSAPYARTLKRGDVFVFAGLNAWAKATQANGAALVLPIGCDPYSLRWPVAGRQVTLSWADGALRDVRRLQDALLAGGASRVVVVAPIYHDSAAPELWRWDA